MAMRRWDPFRDLLTIEVGKASQVQPKRVGVKAASTPRG